MPVYYFMALGVLPGADPSVHGLYEVVPRRWNVGIWDWALIATQHRLHVPYQMADTYAHSCNLEVAIDASDKDEAQNLFRALYVSLLANGSSPFAAPLISTHSVNDLSNISGASRDANDERHARAQAINNKTELVEVWPHPIPGAAVVPPQSERILHSNLFEVATHTAEAWSVIIARKPALRVLEETLISAPQISNPGQGILHMWTGLESLFDTVQTEVSFRLALYLTQLRRPAASDKVKYFNSVKSAYGVRSKVAHGKSLREQTTKNVQSWADTWQILLDAFNSIVARGDLPTEDELVTELLAVSETALESS